MPENALRSPYTAPGHFPLRIGAYEPATPWPGLWHATGETGTTELLNPLRALLEQAKAGPTWHEPVLQLVAKLVARGTPTAVMEAMAPELTWPGYTAEQTRVEIGVMIAGALRKGFAPQEAEPVDADGVEEDVMDVTPPPSASLPPLLTLADIEVMPDPIWLIDDVLVQNSLAVLSGMWGSLKSFVVLDWALSLATGRPWQGRKVVKSDVLLIIGEGVGGLKNRIAAWKQHNKITGPIDGVRVVPMAVNLMELAEAEKLILAVLDAQKAAGFTPMVVIVDTLARAMVGGDENSVKDMSIVVAHADMIRRKLGGATFLAAHHAGKNEGRGMRGSTGLPAALDTTFRAARNEMTVELFCEKQKDGEDGRCICWQRRWTFRCRPET